MVDKMGDRFKAYENVNRFYLTRRMPCILRLDMCHAHTYTKNFNHPFDRIFMDAMGETAKQLCKSITGAKLAYVQSDEISILLTDDDTLETQAWFDKNLQKMCSVAASMASIFFYRAHTNAFQEFYYDCQENNTVIPDWVCNHNNTIAVFDCRAFILPKEEVNNYFYWRESDCRRNSVNMMAHEYFTDKELLHKSTEERKEMLFDRKNIQWELIPSFYKNGVCVRKYKRVEKVIYKNQTLEVPRRRWEIDYNIPIFIQKSDYIEQLLNI